MSLPAGSPNGYLAASLVYFVFAATAPEVKLDDGRTLFLGLRVTPEVSVEPTTSRADRVGSAAGNAFDSQQPIDPAARDSLLAEISRAPAFMQPFLPSISTSRSTSTRSCFSC